jgi:hypothetical protein
MSSSVLECFLSGQGKKRIGVASALPATAATCTNWMRPEVRPATRYRSHSSSSLPRGATRLDERGLPADLQGLLGVQKAVKLDDLGHESGPAGLVAGAQSGTIIAMKVFIKENVIASKRGKNYLKFQATSRTRDSTLGASLPHALGGKLFIVFLMNLSTFSWRFAANFLGC